MSRIRALVNALLLFGLAACEGPTDTKVQAPAAPANQQEAVQSSPGGLSLSSSAVHVSQVAGQSGDRNFLMIDKARGEIIVFENGQATFSGSALTGENPADHMPSDAWGKTFSELRNIKYKITPAGRFTVSSGYDKAYGTTLDVNEVQGKDWDIAIHRVWLGAPAEHRDARLRSPNGQDKHITYGCIDVDAMTMQQLLRRLPNGNGIPLYILPADETLTPKFFQPRDAMQKAPAPSG
jgi:L,D-transpeptidase catalytic domain